MQSCDEILDLLSAALDGELTAAEQAALDEHLAQCPACSALYEDLRLLHDTQPEELTAPADFAARVMDAIAAETAQEKAAEVFPFPARKGRSPWKKWAACAAVIAVVALGAVTAPQWLSMGSSKGDSMAPEMAPDMEGDSALLDDMMQNESQSSSAVEDSSVNAEQNKLQSYDADLHCGLAVLNGTVLPDGLEEYECTRGEERTLVYLVSADYFFSLADAGFFEDASAVTQFELGNPEGKYGLIVVDKTGGTLE